MCHIEGTMAMGRLSRRKCARYSSSIISAKACPGGAFRV